MISLNKRLLTLAAISTLSIGMIACDDDSSNSGKQETPAQQACELNAFKCDGQNLMKCEAGANGNAYNQIAACGAEENCNATAGKCEPKGSTQPQTSTCTAGTFKCETGNLFECKAGADGSTSYEQKAACGVNETCNANAGSCDPKGTSTVTDTIIGHPCHCTDNCTIEVTGKEVKDALTPMTKILVNGALKDSDVSLDTLADDDKITAPNYFSDSITGCEGLVAPEGMKVGCFETAKIEMPESLQSLFSVLKEKIPSLLESFGVDASSLGDIDLNGIFNVMLPLLSEGIQFKSDGGYCTLAAIDIDLNVTDLVIKGFVNMDKVNAIADKIEVGDASKVNIDTACPTGSEMIAFNVDKTSNKGSAQVAFDICMKSCNAPTDCENGTECVEIKDDRGAHKVCFEEDNITYFTNLSKSLGVGEEEPAAGE